MSHGDPRKFYSLFHAKWYDWFKDMWNRFATPKAEADFRSFLQDSLYEETSILELGCGTGKNIESLIQLDLPFSSYLGLDFTPDMLNQAKSKFKGNEKIQFQQQDISNLSNLDKTYDIIISTWVMSHLNSPHQVINEAQKFLKPNGSLYLMFMTQPKWFIHLWFWPFMILFKARYVSELEVNKIVHVNSSKSYTFNLANSIHIKQDA